MSVDELGHKLHYKGFEHINQSINQNNILSEKMSSNYGYNINNNTYNNIKNSILPYVRENTFKRSLGSPPKYYPIPLNPTENHTSLSHILNQNSPQVDQFNQNTLKEKAHRLTGIHQLNLPDNAPQASYKTNENYNLQSKAPKLEYGTSVNTHHSLNQLPPITINSSMYEMKDRTNGTQHYSAYQSGPIQGTSNYYQPPTFAPRLERELYQPPKFTNTISYTQPESNYNYQGNLQMPSYCNTNHYPYQSHLSITPFDNGIQVPNQSPLSGYAQLTHPNTLNHNALKGLMIPPIHPVNDSTYSLPNLADSFPIDNEVIAYDDKDGHLVIQPDLYITERYKVESLLGQGTFGRVAKCWDKRALRYVAVKVVRAIPKYREAAKIEMRVLSTLKKHDPLNLNKCIHMENDFEFNNHMCMSFDLMGPSLFDFLKSNQFQGFPFPHVQHFARQLLNSISFVHNLGLVHTDLKPENILLLNGSYDEVKRKGSKVKHILKSTEIKLIDFGSATFEDEFHSSIVSTRHYRAPEIILGMGWSYPCDLWSVGCILIELITGDAMFQTHENLEHLAMMARALGPLPKVMYERASSKTGKAYFKSSAELNYPNDETTKQSLKNVNGVKTVAKIVNRKGLLGDALTDLITKLLTYEPEDRITAAQALEHPFFSLRLGLDGRIKHKKGLDMSSSN